VILAARGAGEAKMETEMGTGTATGTATGTGEVTNRCAQYDFVDLSAQVDIVVEKEGLAVWK
jgi:hypothetical protein